MGHHTNPPERAQTDRTPFVPGTSEPRSRHARNIGRLVLRLALAILACVLIAALLASFAARSQVSQQTLQDWVQLAAAIKRWGLFLQCMVLAAVGIWWHRIVAWGLARNIVKRHELARVLRMRAAVLALGVAYLLLVPIGPATLWRYLGLGS